MNEIIILGDGRLGLHFLQPRPILIAQVCFELRPLLGLPALVHPLVAAAEGEGIRRPRPHDFTRVNPGQEEQEFLFHAFRHGHDLTVHDGKGHLQIPGEHERCPVQTPRQGGLVKERPVRITEVRAQDGQ